MEKVNHKEKRIHKSTRIFIGWFYVAIGIIGIILPVIPGWIFLFAGGSILGWKWIKDLIKEIRNYI